MLEEIKEITKIKETERFDLKLGESKKEATRIKTEIQKQAKSIYWQCFLLMLVILFVADLMITCGVFLTVGSIKTLGSTFFVGLFLAIYLTLFVSYIAKGYKGVPEKENWTIEFFGSFIDVWEPGPHLLTLPFFMQISGKVSMATQMLSLYMDGQKHGREKDAIMEFKDASAGLRARLFIEVFSAHRAVYNIDDFRVAVKEKADSSLRAHYGNTLLDTALEERANIKAQTIIDGLKKDAGSDTERDEARQFKLWGVEIKSFAVVDIELPELIVEQRNSIIKATKERDVSKTKIETAKNEAEAQRIRDERLGKGLGQEIQQIAEETKLDPSKAMAYVRDLRFFEAIKGNKGVVLPGNTTGSILTSEIASIANLASSAIKESEINDKIEKEKKS